MGQNFNSGEWEEELIMISCTKNGVSALLSSPKTALPDPTGEIGNVEVTLRFDSLQPETEMWRRIPGASSDALFSLQPESFIKSLVREQISSRLVVRSMGRAGSAWTSIFDISEAKAVAQEVLERMRCGYTSIS